LSTVSCARHVWCGGFVRLTTSGLATILLAACGSDSEPQPGPPVPPPINQAPAFTSPSAANVAENSAGTIYQAAATDPEGGTVTFSIVGGADAARFFITSAGALSFVSSPNFDLPVDADRDNVYQVQLAASDGQSSSTLVVTIAVTNLREGISIRRVGSGFVNPTSLAAVSDTILLVAERGGAIYRFDTQTGVKSLLVHVNAGGAGVLAVAAAPDFATSGSFFVLYQASTRAIIVQRYLRGTTGPVVPENTGPLLSVPGTNSDPGGWLGFGPDGSLLIATGDEGGDGDPTGSAQNPQTFAGKLIRVTPNPDPFAGASPQYFLLTRVARGLHRPTNGTFVGENLLLLDQGQDVSEEVNLFTGMAGANFGWPAKEGTRVVRGDAPAQAIDPVVEYPRSQSGLIGQGVVGGAISPSAVPSLNGHFIFADKGGAFFSVPVSSIQAGRTLGLADIERRDQDFAPDVGSLAMPVALVRSGNGMVFILDGRGDIFRIDGG
jgi:glucose/arabinose dehydrogenase